MDRTDSNTTGGLQGGLMGIFQSGLTGGLATPHPCPSCGHCPTCGRGGYQFVPYPGPNQPYYPYPNTTPWYPAYRPVITCGSGALATQTGTNTTVIQ